MAERSRQDYEIYYNKGEVIGVGGFGLVFEGKDKESKEVRAIKRITIGRLREELTYEYNNKIEIDK